MTSRKQILSHSGLRGVAALMVVGYHLQLGGGYHLWIEDATLLLKRSYLFVDLFFVLSGFILSYVNHGSSRELHTPRQYGRFLLRRWIRLYPLLFATLVFMLVERSVYCSVMTSIGRVPKVELSLHSLVILGSQFLLLNAFAPSTPGWNVPTWSISAEFGAYLLFPFLLGAVVRRTWTAASALLLASLAFYLTILARDGSLDIVVGLAPLRCLAGFALGILVFQARHLVGRIASPLLGLLQVACCAAILGILMVGAPDPLVIPFFAAFVMLTWQDRGIVAKALASRLPVYLGDISYSIYLTHVCVLEVITLLWRGPEIEDLVGSDPARAMLIILAYAAILLVSRFTFTRIEVPARAWLGSRLLSGRELPIGHSPPAP